MEDYLRTVGEETSRMGTQHDDPRLTSQGQSHLQLRQLNRAHQKTDPPPERAKPAPIQLTMQAVNRLQTNAVTKAKADMIISAFFFLLHAGEHAKSRNESAPFRLQDVSFSTPQGVPNAATGDIALIAIAHKVHLLRNFWCWTLTSWSRCAST